MEHHNPANPRANLPRWLRLAGLGCGAGGEKAWRKVEAMNLREYAITVILLLAIAAGCYSWLSAVLLASAETTSQQVHRGF